MTISNKCLWIRLSFIFHLFLYNFSPSFFNLILKFLPYFLSSLVIYPRLILYSFLILYLLLIPFPSISLPLPPLIILLLRTLILYFPIIILSHLIILNIHFMPGRSMFLIKLLYHSYLLHLFLFISSLSLFFT